MRSPMVVKTGPSGSSRLFRLPQCKTTKPLALGVKCPQPIAAATSCRNGLRRVAHSLPAVIIPSVSMPSGTDRCPKSVPRARLRSSSKKSVSKTAAASNVATKNAATARRIMIAESGHSTLTSQFRLLSPSLNPHRLTSAYSFMR